MIAFLFCLVVSVSFGAIPNNRPPPSQRKFNSSAVEAFIGATVPRFIDPDLGTMFSNCLPNTLDTTVQLASSNDTFM
jgi:hypothetical protein